MEVDFKASKALDAALSADGNALFAPPNGDFAANRGKSLSLFAPSFKGSATYHVPSAIWDNVLLQVEAPATVTASNVQLYGTNGNPDDAAVVWAPLGGAISGSGYVQELAIFDYLMASLSGYAGTGDVLLHLLMTNR